MKEYPQTNLTGLLEAQEGLVDMFNIVTAQLNDFPISWEEQETEVESEGKKATASLKLLKRKQQRINERLNPIHHEVRNLFLPIQTRFDRFMQQQRESADAARKFEFLFGRDNLEGFTDGGELPNVPDVISACPELLSEFLDLKAELESYRASLLAKRRDWLEEREEVMRKVIPSIRVQEKKRRIGAIATGVATGLGLGATILASVALVPVTGGGSLLGLLTLGSLTAGSGGAMIGTAVTSVQFKDKAHILEVRCQQIEKMADLLLPIADSIALAEQILPHIIAYWESANSYLKLSTQK